MPPGYFRFIGHLDTFAAVARLHTLNGSEEFPLVITDTWKSGSFLLKRAMGLVQYFELDFLQARAEKIAPGHALPLQAEPDDIALMLPLVTNPGVFHYCGPEVIHMEAGCLWWMNRAAPAAIGNAGDSPAFVMVIHAAKRVAPPEAPLP